MTDAPAGGASVINSHLFGEGGMTQILGFHLAATRANSSHQSFGCSRLSKANVLKFRHIAG
jgi:hypothetical protein